MMGVGDNLESDDESVLGCAEQVHGVDQPVVDDDDQPEDEEGGVLKDDGDEDPPDVQIAADLLGLLTSGGVQVHDFILNENYFV